MSERECERCGESGKDGSKFQVTPDSICIYWRWWCYECQEKHCCARMMIELAA